MGTRIRWTQITTVKTVILKSHCHVTSYCRSTIINSYSPCYNCYIMGRWSGARIDYMTFPFIKQEMSWRDPAREHQPQQYHATLAMQIFKVVFMTFRRSLSNLIWYISTDRGEKITIKSNWINSPNQKLCLANMFRTQLWLLRDSGRARSEGGTLHSGLIQGSAGQVW